MLNKKFLLGVTLSMALCLSSCYNDDEEITETTVPTEVTTAAVTTVSETTTVEETTTEYDEENHESGLVFFVQPIIEQYDEYDDWNLADWECRDTEVRRGDHYDGEWKYRKELIFAFSNYTDEPVIVDSIQIFSENNGEPVRFTNGSDILNINFTVQPLHKTDYLLQAEDFDYSSCESGIYLIQVNFNSEAIGMEFFIDNSPLYEERHISENQIRSDPETDRYIPYEYTVYAPMFLNEEQRHIFAQAYGLMWDWFWDEYYMPQSYTDTHTTDDFLAMLYEVFTEEYAKRLAADYIDENGELINYGGGRGTNINYVGHCFMPVSADEDQVTLKAVVICCHSDNPYKIWFEEIEYHMVNTKNGWRVFQFDLWN